MECIRKATVSRSIYSSFAVVICATSFIHAVHGNPSSIRDAFTQDVISCPENWDLFIQDKICLSRPSEAEVQTHDVAQKICRRQGGYLATATDPQIEFISQNYAVNPNQNRSEMNFWMNYVMIHNNRNSSTWNVAQEPVDEQQPEQLPSGLLPTSVPKNLSDSSVICLQLLFKYNRNKVDREWKPSNCNQRVPYMCEKPASGHCIDRLGNMVAEGEQFSPRSRNDPCIRCHCYQGTASICSSASCGKPICDAYIPDANECCKYDCVDSNGNIYIPKKDGDELPPVYLGDSMRWVLTMITSFLLLGMMLFMVYRMRQKRLAYLRYRVRQLQESQMDFEPGSGPPVPSVDDLDGGFFREPPPPYSFFNDDPLHKDSPPPYQHHCNNQSRRLMLDRSSRRSDEVSLLRHSATGSVPASPASDQASASVFITPTETPNNTSPDDNLPLTAAHASCVSAATTPVESATSTPLNANTSMTSFLGDPMTSPGRNTAV
ncbi:integral membrane protein DGCR2/IDD-like isoform X2 [Apostichopus japonicus]|uniref:integral membrane protein DGCR2/IDD-like isoform X2 n=1 Tax=Stichopus japonicus TaxID=307972 RepID=UPI003AB12320